MNDNTEIVDRIEYLKNSVSPVLNAEFYSDITDIAPFFKITEELDIPLGSSAIVGSIDGFYYCLCEFKNNNEIYTLCSIVIDEKIPNFTFATKDFYIHRIQDHHNTSCLDKLFDILYLMVVIPFLVFFVHFFINNLKMNSFRLLDFNNFLLLFIILVIYSLYKTNKRLSKTNEFVFDDVIIVPHNEFNEKYDLISEKDNSSLLQEKFDSDFCEHLLNYKPEISYFRSKDGVMQLKTQDELLNTDNCFKVINSCVSLARQFKDRLRN